MTTLAPAPTAPLIRLLGPLELCGHAPRPKAKKIRSVLALLALNAGDYVPAEDFYSELWGHSMPKAARQAVQTYIMWLRQHPDIGYEGISTGASGYALTLVAREDVDALRFVRLVDQARREHAKGYAPLALDTLRAAMSLWRGDPLVDVQCGPILSGWAARFADRHRSAVSLRFDIAMAAGRHRDILDDLRVAWRADPCREDTAALLMLALYRSQRRVDALAVFSATREALREEHGLDPGPSLVRLQAQILAGDPSLEMNGEQR